MSEGGVLAPKMSVIRTFSFVNQEFNGLLVYWGLNLATNMCIPSVKVLLKCSLHRKMCPRDDSSSVRRSLSTHALVKIAVRQYITSGSSSSFAITIILPRATSAACRTNEQWLLLRVLQGRPQLCSLGCVNVACRSTQPIALLNTKPHK